MKKLLIYIILFTSIFSACKKDNDHVFDESPDVRMKAKLSEYQKQLAGATSGWKAMVYPSGGGAFSFYFKFNDSNRVKMLSDFTLASATTFAESSYRLKALQQPSLLFDTYSYIHVLCDPEPSENGGEQGLGLKSDFEFYFDSTTADTIKLVGRFNGSKAVLVRATPAEATSYSTGQLGVGYTFNNFSKYLSYFRRVVLNGISYEISADFTLHTLTFKWVDGNGVLHTFTTNYYYSFTGIVFQTPLIAGNQTINGFTNIAWDATNSVLSFNANQTATSVTNSDRPVKVDLQAPQRWYNQALSLDVYWYSIFGFHVNGVDDAFNVRSITSGASTFYYYIYYPQFYTNPYDLFAPVLISGSSAAISAYKPVTASPPTFTSDGRIVFTYLGNAGTAAVPTNGPAAKSNAQIGSVAGYYLIQTSTTSYDMVSALDGKTWITWYLIN